MEFGVAFASRVGDHDLVRLAEELGYEQAWFYDSQMVYSDVYATMALAAHRTQRIRLGTGVAVPSTRMAPTIAHSIATINELAPGRVELGIGVGNTARLTMGLPPVKFSRMRADVRLIRKLLDGETATMRAEGKETRVRFLHPDRGFINLRDRIPITLSAFQPKGVEFCGAECDAHMVWGLPPQYVQMFRSIVGQAAEKAGRKPDDVPMKGIYPTAVLAPGETSASPRILRSVESFVTNAYHFLVEWGTSPMPIPPELEVDVERYKAYVATLPKEERHLIMHQGHLVFAREEEREFVTPAMAELAANIAEPDELVARIHALEDAGLSHYAIQVTDEPERQLRDFAEQVIRRY
jgi:alkanesulfonate monooxygenase SsuD/methylene tetrahydromethanopterin reductase-like flavin-dependent oxidoreductase (luciferase family)